jgi:DNA-directed RNA polymerase sigma subunit (sigma70/sigma32)
MHQAPPWQNPRILTTLLFVFLSGAITGAIAMRFGYPRETHRTVPYWTQGGKELSVQRLKKELDLTPEQAREMETVLDDFVMYIQTLQAQMDDVKATGKKNVMKLLNEEQKQKFERMMTELQAKQR